MPAARPLPRRLRSHNWFIKDHTTLEWDGLLHAKMHAGRRAGWPASQRDIVPTLRMPLD
jgi:hypothetical protein